jgi:DNA polymerase
MEPLTKKQFLAMLNSEYFNCTKCKLHKTAKKKVFGIGNPNADIMLVGIGPGEKEDKQGVPFIGDSGGLLRELLKKSRMPTDNLYITNLVLCRPFDKIKKERAMNRDPLKDELLGCRQRLEQEIYIVDPNILILLGKPPLLNLARVNADMTKTRGKVLKVPIVGKNITINYPAIATWHPAYLLRKGPLIKGDPLHQTFEDLIKAKELSKQLDEEYTKFEKEN